SCSVMSNAGPVTLVRPPYSPGGESAGSVSQRSPPYSRIAVGPPTSWIPSCIGPILKIGFGGLGRLQVDHLQAEALGQPLGDQRAMAGLGGGLHAHERGDPVHRQPADQRLEGREIQYLLGVGADVLGRQPHPRALADALPVIVAVLELTHLGIRSELRVILVADVRVG